MEAINFKKGEKPHPNVVKHSKGWAHGIEHLHSSGGHSVQSAGGDEGTSYHHIDNTGNHRGTVMHNHDEDIPSKGEIKKKMPHAPSHVHDAVHKHLKTHFAEDYSMDSQEYYSKYISSYMKNYVQESNDLSELDKILSEMPEDALNKLAEGPFSPVGKFMMKRKLSKGISKNREKEKANKDYAHNAWLSRDDNARKMADNKSKDAEKQASRQSRALTRLNRPESYSDYISNQMKNSRFIF